MRLDQTRVPRFVVKHQLDRPRHIAFHPINVGPLDRSTTRPVVAYLSPDETAVDWLYDGLVVDHSNLTEKNRLSDFVEPIFGGQLQALADVVEDLRKELHDPDYRLMIHLKVPAGDDAPTSQIGDRIDAMVDNFTRLGRPELQLVGFYFGVSKETFDFWYDHQTQSYLLPSHPEVHTPDADTVRHKLDNASAAFQHLRGTGYELIWVPAHNARLSLLWKRYFDRVVTQPNYAFGDIAEHTAFSQADSRCSSYDLSGVELEFSPSRNPQIYELDPNPELASATSYLKAGDGYNWAAKSLTVTYYSQVVAEYSRSIAFRKIYDGLFQYISRAPRRSVLTRVPIEAQADSALQRNANRVEQVQGSDDLLIIGAATDGSSGRAYLRFELPAGLKSDVLAAIVRVYAAEVHPFILAGGESFPVDVDLCLLEEAHPFDEVSTPPAGMATGDQMNHAWPGARPLIHFVNRYFIRSTGFVAMDVSEAVVRAVQLGKTSLEFILGRGLMYPWLRESDGWVKLVAREAGRSADQQRFGGYLRTIQALRPSLVLTTGQRNGVPDSSVQIAAALYDSARRRNAPRRRQARG